MALPFTCLYGLVMIARSAQVAIAQQRYQRFREAFGGGISAQIIWSSGAGWFASCHHASRQRLLPNRQTADARLQTTQTQLQRNVITLKGSAQTVSEFFEYGVNNILYQRGIYPPEAFEAKKQYGLALWQSTDEKLSQYLSCLMSQCRTWLEQGSMRQFVLVVTEADTKEVLERWTFDIETNKDVLAGTGPLPAKPDKEITNEIQAIMRQITASVTFLPLLETRCTIDILVYTNQIDDLPDQWEDSAPRNILNAEIVSLRGFSTKVHGVKTMVAYKAPSDDML